MRRNHGESGWPDASRIGRRSIGAATTNILTTAGGDCKVPGDYPLPHAEGFMFEADGASSELRRTRAALVSTRLGLGRKSLRV